MIFPDGTKKEGYFENNIYKVKVQITNNEGQMLRTNPADVQHSAAQLSLGEGLKHDNSEF
jgi:hypothetical protein